MIESPDILRLIENSTLLRGVSHEILEPLFSKAKRVVLKPGDKLLAPGKINENVYFVISGRLVVQVSPSSSEKPLAMLTPGECVGDMSVLVDGMVSAYVIAASDCELLVIDYAAFWALIDGSNEAARNMLNILVHRVRLGNAVAADELVHHDTLTDGDIIDKLTGLYNYYGIRRKFDRLLQRCVIDKQSLCLIVMEVDEQGPIGGSMESLYGDQSLRAIAQTILTFLRPDDHSARLIGKKFAVLLTNVSLPDAHATAERLRATISHIPILLPDGNERPPVTISAGVCEALPVDIWGTLIARADIALEQAIAAGHNRVVSS